MTQDEFETKFRELRTFIRDEIGDLKIDLRERVDGVNERVDGVNQRLDVLNGRTRTSEIAIAVLEDRSDRAEALARQATETAATHARYWGGGAGAFVGGVVIAVIKFFSGH